MCEHCAGDAEFRAAMDGLFEEYPLMRILGALTPAQGDAVSFVAAELLLAREHGREALATRTAALLERLLGDLAQMYTMRLVAMALARRVCAGGDGSVTLSAEELRGVGADDAGLSIIGTMSLTGTGAVDHPDGLQVFWRPSEDVDAIAQAFIASGDAPHELLVSDNVQDAVARASARALLGEDGGSDASR